jgi:ECF sigma factor
MPDDGGTRPRNHVQDQRQLAALQAANFRGPVWDRFAEHLADYGVKVMVAWIETGQVFTRMREKSCRLRLHPPSDGRTLTGDTPVEIAIETVGRALNAFRKVLEKEGWSAAGGASLQTYFVGQCLFCFPNVYRRWLGETRPPPWQAVEILEDLTEKDYRYGGHHGADPADQVECRLDLERAEQRLCEELDPRTFFVLQKCMEGYTQAEIAEMLGISPRKVERLVAKHRQWQQRRDMPEEEAS